MTNTAAASRTISPAPVRKTFRVEAPLAIAFVAIPLFALGLWASEATARDLGVKDHGSIVIDEIAAFLPLAALASASLVLQLVAFALVALTMRRLPDAIAKGEEGAGWLLAAVHLSFAMINAAAIGS